MDETARQKVKFSPNINMETRRGIIIEDQEASVDKKPQYALIILQAMIENDRQRREDQRKQREGVRKQREEAERQQ